MSYHMVTLLVFFPFHESAALIVPFCKFYSHANGNLARVAVKSNSGVVPADKALE